MFKKKEKTEKEPREKKMRMYLTLTRQEHLPYLSNLPII